MSDRTAPGLGRGFSAGRPSLVTYLMAGYPDRSASLAALRAVTAAGADVIELGVPYADPVADGPVIARAAEVARAGNEGGFGLAETLALAAEFTAEAPGRVPPIALMTYLNPMMRLGFEKLAAAAADAGVSGFIVPDLLPDSPMTARWLAASRPHGIDTVFLVAPTSTPARLDAALTTATGFVYVVSALGVTGERSELPAELSQLVERVRVARGEMPLPVAVGFGVSNAEQAASVAGVADGVIVGSAIVRRQADREALEAFVRELADAVHAACRGI